MVMVKKNSGKNKGTSEVEVLPQKKKKYFSGVGRRKLAVARVRIFPAGSKKQNAAKEYEISINEKPHIDYFCLSNLKEIVASPLNSAGLKLVFNISVKVRGGGIKSQAEAVRLGLSRALVKYDENLKKTFRNLGYLTRDARIVERKKAGLKKARRAPQWKKR